MTAEIIDGRRIAAIVREEVRLEVGHLRRETGTVPNLAVVIVGNDPASDVYVRMKNGRPGLWALILRPCASGRMPRRLRS